MGNFFKLKIKVAESVCYDPEEYIFLFFAVLYNNGQIEHDFSLMQKDGEYYANVFALEDTFLDRENFSELGAGLLETLSVERVIVGTNVDAPCVCRCDASEVALYYQDTINSSPVKCCDCEGDIPLYKLGKLEGIEDFFEFRKWKEVCGALDSLWKNSVMDCEINQQIQDRDSEFCKWTEKLCGILGKMTHKKVVVELPSFDVF